MPRDPRIVVEDYELIEISNRVIHGRHLLRPDRRLEAIIHGAIGRAQRKYGVVVHHYIFLSTHYHLLASFRDSEQMAAFVCYFQAKIAKEVARLYGWSDRLWSRRYDSIPVPPDAAHQIARLRYLLANGCKEGLVASPLDWPGASATWALSSGSMEVSGVWIDRTAQCRARHRSGRAAAADFTQSESVRLSPLPCWAQLQPARHRRRIRALITEIERETRRGLRALGTRPLGVRKIRRQDPRARAPELESSPKPKVHALTRDALEAFRSAWEVILAAYRRAAQRLRHGHSEVVFPPGCFPPGLPYVPG